MQGNQDEKRIMEQLASEAKAIEEMLAELRQEREKSEKQQAQDEKPKGKTLAEVFEAEQQSPIHDCALKHNCLGCLNDSGVCAYCGEGAPVNKCPGCSHPLPIPEEFEKAQAACDAPLPGEWNAFAATPSFDKMLDNAKRSAAKYAAKLDTEAVIKRFLDWLAEDNLRMAGEAFVSGYCSALEENSDGEVSARASEAADHYCAGMFDANSELNMRVIGVLEQFSQRPEMQHAILPSSVLKELMDALVAEFEQSHKHAKARQETFWKKD